jgi:hypothetical protein
MRGLCVVLTPGLQKKRLLAKIKVWPVAILQFSSLMHVHHYHYVVCVSHRNTEDTHSQTQQLHHLIWLCFQEPASPCNITSFIALVLMLQIQSKLGPSVIHCLIGVWLQYL